MFQTRGVENIKTHILYRTTFSENRAFYEVMWKNNVERNKPQMTIWRTRIACWILRATHTHSEYEIFNCKLLKCFSQQEWLR